MQPIQIKTGHHMSLYLKDLDILRDKSRLSNLAEGKLLINTINAHSYNMAQKDALFAEALAGGDVLIPDGAPVPWACRFLKHKNPPVERCAGWDLFVFEMERWNEKGGKVMFVGSSEKVLSLIRQRAAEIYPNLEIVTLSPPFKAEFTEEDNREIIGYINTIKPDLLWIGMTAPKQEKWTYSNWEKMDISCHVACVGAVFDFFAGTTKRAPLWWQNHGMEWFYRLCSEPKRMFKRYVVGNPLFLYNVLMEKLKS